MRFLFLRASFLRASLLRASLFCAVTVFTLSWLSVASLSASIANFEGFPDSTSLTTQYPGLTFGNSLILTAGVSLNEFEFPPFSGTNVVSDFGGPISIAFASPVTFVSGYFTYVESLTLTAFDSANQQVGSAVSLFSSNLAVSGVPGSAPNELISLSNSGGIARVQFAGGTNGSSFTLDELAYTGQPTTVTPEPRTLVMLGLGLAGLSLGRNVVRKRAS